LRPEDPQSEAEAALREAAWLQSVARALVGTESDAADLAQDVQVAALTGGPPAERAPRRAWLRTVARRLAARRARRDARRREGERARADELRDGAAGSPAADAIAARLALQRRLADALERIPLADRELLVRRHFDGASAPEIAAELGLSPAAVRQRLVRATDRLRAEFARTDEEWRAWSPALALAAFGRDAAGALAGAASSTTSLPGTSAQPSPRSLARANPAAAAASSLIPLAIMKKLILVAATALALVAAGWLITADSGSDRPGEPASAARGGLEPLDGLQTAGGTDLGRVEAGTERTAAVAASRTAAAEIVVLDEDFGPVPGVRGVWIEAETGATIELPFDEHGSAPRPEAESGRILVVGTRHRFREIEVSSFNEPSAPILLSAASIVRGLLIVDGSLSPRAHAFTLSEQFTTNAYWPESVRPGLIDRVLQVASSGLRAVRPNASGEFEIVLRADRARLWIPESFELSRAEIDGRLAAPAGDGRWSPHLLEVSASTERVTIWGHQPAGFTMRFVDETDGTPWKGSLHASYRMVGPGGSAKLICDPSDGSAFLAVPGLDDAEADPLFLVLDFMAYERFGSTPFAQRYFPDEVPVERDLGTIVVPVAETMSIRVIHEKGGERRVARNARVCIGNAVKMCDEEGRATVPWPEEEVLYATADGCSVERCPRPDPSDDVHEVVLSSGPSIHVDPGGLFAEGETYCVIRFPDESFRPSARGAFQLLSGRTPARSGRNAGERVNYMLYALGPVRGPRLSGLPEDAPVEIQIIDASGYSFHEESLLLTEPIEYLVKPESVERADCFLTVEVVGSGPQGIALPPAELRLERPGAGPDSAHSFLLQPGHKIGPLAAGDVEIHAVSRPYGTEWSGTARVHLSSGANRARIVLEESD